MLRKYHEIVREYENAYIPYNILLNSIEWQELRNLILQRDKEKCQVCHKEGTKKSPFGTYCRDLTKEEIVEFSNKFIEMNFGGHIIKIKHAIPANIKVENPVILHVHHKYYIKGRLPWSYKENALITVCSQCHSKIHEEEKILIYDDERFENSIIMKVCTKCSGTGHIDEYHYHQNGICFDCNGQGMLL